MIARFMTFLSVKRQAYSVKKLDLPSKVFLGLALITATYFLHASIPAYPQTAHAAPGINQQLNFQGRLLNSDGTLIENDTYSVVFSLYTTDEGGGAIWSETQSVTTTQGLFRVSLGSVNPLSSINFNQDSLYLGIKVGTDPEMSPRMRFHSTPYAFEAKRVSGLTVTNNGNNTLNIANGKTATFNNTIAFSGTDGTTFTLPSSSGTLVSTGAEQTLSNKTINGLIASGSITLSSLTTNGGVLYTNGSGLVAQTTAGSSGQCLQSNGGGAPTWGTCGTANTITGTGAAGRLAFWDGASSMTSDSGLVWDNTNKRLGINTTPTVDLEVDGSSILYSDSGGDGLLVGTSSSSSSQYALSVVSGASPYTIIYAQADGKVGFGTDTPTSQWDFYKEYSTSDETKAMKVVAIQDTPGASVLYAGEFSAEYTGTSGTKQAVGGLIGTARLKGSGGTTTSAYGIGAGLLVSPGATSTNSTTLNSQTTFEDGSSGTSHFGIAIQTSLGTGATLENRHGLIIADVASSGALTNQTGVTIGALTAATNNTYLLIGTSTTPAGNHALYSASAYASTLRGALYINTGNDATVAGADNQHFFLRTNSNTDGVGSGMGFSVSSDPSHVGAKIVFERTGGNSMGDLVFYTKPNVTAGDTSTAKLRIAADGLITFNSYTTAGGILYTDGSGVIGQTVAGTTGQCLQSNNGAAPTWGSCGTAGITGTGTAGQIAFWDSASSQTGDNSFAWSSTNKFLAITSSNNGLTAGVTNQHIVLRHDQNTNGAGPGISFTTSSNATVVGAKIVFERTGGNSMGDLVFFTKPDIAAGDSTTEKMRIASDGTVTLKGYTTAGGLLFANGSGVLAQTTAGSSGQCLQSNGGGTPVWGSCSSQSTREMVITPEYTNATLTSNGAVDTDGTLVGDNTGASGNFRNYYEWTSSQASLQQYTIAVRVKLPLDFDEWDTTGFSLEYQTGTASTAENAVSATITPATEADTNHACDLSTDRASTTWTTTNMTCSGSTLSSGSYTWDDAGESAIIRVTVKSSSAANAFARAGDITLRYRATQ